MADPFALLVRASLDVSAAVLAVLALRRPARRLAGAAFAYRLWMLVPLAAAAIALPPPLKGLSLLPVRAAPIAARLASSASIPPATSLDTSHAPAAATPAVRAALSLPPAAVAKSLAVVVWALGLAGFGVIILVRQRRYLRALGQLESEPRLEGVFLSQAQSVGPAVVGTLRAFVVLPRDFHQRYDAQEGGLILAHERTHLAQRHHLEGGLGVLLLAAQWFNPLAYLAYRLFRVDQELACDAAVIATHPRERAAYARAMFKSQAFHASAPFACQWPGGADHPFKERLTMLNSKTPSRLRRRLAGAALAALLTAGVYVAYAAEPSAPDQLPKEVVGVVGSGDQLSLQIKDENGPRTIKIGDEYKDGWKLKALTDATATLAKAGEARQVGLNPAGALAQEAPSGPPSSVRLAGRVYDAATVQAYLQRAAALAPQAPIPGLNRDQTAQMIAESMMLNDYIRTLPQYAAAKAAGKAFPIDTDYLDAVFGPDFQADSAARVHGWAAAAYAQYDALPVDQRPQYLASMQAQLDQLGAQRAAADPNSAGYDALDQNYAILKKTLVMTQEHAAGIAP